MSHALPHALRATPCALLVASLCARSVQSRPLRPTVGFATPLESRRQVMLSGWYRGVLQRETIEVLIRPKEGKALLDAIYRKADILPRIGEVLSHTHDPKDDTFISCALVGKAEYVISVDRDLLVLGRLQGVRVVTPYEFVNRSPAKV